MVISSANQTAVTPEGKPVAEPIPVAPVVAIVIDGVKGVFATSVGFVEGVPAVLVMIQPHEGPEEVIMID